MAQTERATYGTVTNGIGAYRLPPFPGSSGDKRNRRRYRVVYQDHKGKVRTKSGFLTKQEAAHWQAHNTTALDRNEYIDKNQGKTLFRSYAEQWLTIKRDALRPKTVDLYRYLLDKLIFPTFGSVQLRRIARTDIKAWLATLRQSQTTRAKAYRLIRQILQEAELDRRILQNPLHHPIPFAATEPATRTYDEPPTVQQVRQLADAVPEQFKPLVLLAGFCGLRWGEAIALERRHINLGARTVTIEQQVQEINGHLTLAKELKTEAGRRTVRLPEEVAEALDKHLRRGDPADLLFPARLRNGKRNYLRNSSFRRSVWLPACEQVGVSFHFHDLRHTTGTLLANTGASRADRMRAMGHKSRNAADRYEHATQSGQDELAAAMDILLAASPSPAATGTDNVLPLRRK